MIKLTELRNQFNVPEGEFPLDLERLPNKIKIFIKALAQTLPEVPIESLLLDILVKIAQLETIHRVSAKTIDGDIIPANIYSIIFMPSGEGKDIPLGRIDSKVFVDVKEKFKEIVEVYKKKTEEDNYIKAQTMSKAQGNKYMYENRPRNLPWITSEGTMEGLSSAREAYQQAGLGGTFFKIGEFADYITSNNAARRDLLTYLKEIYERGDNTAKLTKGDRDTKDVEGVPNNSLFHSSIEGLQTDEGRGILLNFLNRGSARRSFFCYPDIKPIDVTIEHLRDDREKQSKIARDGYIELEGVREYANIVLQELNVIKPFEIEWEAQEVIDDYKLCNRSLEMPVTTKEVVKAERKGRFWKCFKLSTILAAWEHPDDRRITKEDVLNGIYLTEYYGQHFEKLIANPVISDAEMVFNKFIEEVGTWFTKTDIRSWGLCGWGKFKDWFNEVMPEVDMFCIDKGYRLLEKKYGTNGKQYSIEEIKPVDISKIRMSVSNDNPTKPEKSVNFEPIETSFDNIKEVVWNNICYSGARFKDNYRKDDGVIIGQDVVILDIDDGWSINEALEYLKKCDYKAKIITTRSHQKEKNGKKCDRFRIFLPLASEMKLDREHYREILSAIILIFMDKPDKACKNIGRMYFGHKGEVFDSEGTQLFDWTRIKVSSVDVYRPQEVINSEGNTFRDLWRSGNIELIKQLTKWDENFVDGNRNNYAARMFLWFRDSGELSYEENKALIRALNNGKLSESELDSTVFAKTKRY